MPNVLAQRRMTGLDTPTSDGMKWRLYYVVELHTGHFSFRSPSSLDDVAEHLDGVFILDHARDSHRISSQDAIDISGGVPEPYCWDWIRDRL